MNIFKKFSKKKKDKLPEMYFQLDEILDSASMEELKNFFEGYFNDMDKAAAFFGVIIRAIAARKGPMGIQAVMTVCKRIEKEFFGDLEDRKKRWKKYDEVL